MIRYHYIPTRMAKIKKFDHTKYIQDLKQLDLPESPGYQKSSSRETCSIFCNNL